MAQYQEGQYLQGSDGRMYVVRNGVPVTAGPQALVQNPKLPGELTGQDLTNREKALGIQKTAGTMAAEETSAKNAAISSGIDVKSKQIDLNLKTGTPPGDPTKTGADYLNSLPQGVRDLTNAMLNNRYPAVINRNIPVVNQAVLAANHLNPAFDATKYNMRVSLLNHTMAGSDADELKALNTAITHAGVLHDQTAKLPGGADYGWAPLTHTINAFENWSHSSEPGYKNFLDTMQKYSQEEAKTYGINAQGGQQQTQTNYDINDPGKTIQSNIKNDIGLLGGRAAAILNKYNVGNAGQAPLEALSPDARAVLERLAPDVLKKFSNRPDPMAQAMGIPFPGAAPPPSAPPPNNGGGGGNITTVHPIINPSGTGPAALAGSTNGYSDKPNPALTAYWENAARQGVPFSKALSDWQADPANKGMSLNAPPPAKYQQAANYFANNPGVEYHPFQGITRTQMGPIASAWNDAVQSPPGVFAGHYYDSLGANIPTSLMGDKGALYNAITSQDAPKSALLGNVLGTVGGASTLTKGIRAAAPSLGAYGNIIGGSASRAALTGDALFGATSGAAQNPDNPFLGGVLGMGAMAAGNGLGQVAGRGIARGLDNPIFQWMVNKGRGMFGGSPLNPPAQLNPGQAMTLNRASPAIDGITQNLQDASNAGLPYTLADAHPKMRALLGQAVRKSPDVQAAAEAFLQPRQMGQAERAIGQINGNLAPVGDVPSIVTDAQARAQQAAAPLYNQAYAIPGRTSPAMDNLLATPAGKQALSRARVIAANEQRDPNALGFDLNDQGETTLMKVPSVQTLDYVKRGLDDTLEQYRDPITGKLNLDEAGRAINGVRANFLNEADRLFPEYAAARQAYQGIASQGTAAQKGAAATSTKITPEQTQTMLANAGDNLPYFQQGYASNMADQIERQRLSGNPYNLVNGSLGQRTKLPLVFPNGASNFQRVHGLEDDMGKTYTEALGGSQTAGRTQADKAFDNADIAMDLAQSAISGAPPLSMGMTLLRKASDWRNMGAGVDRANSVGPMLLNPDPSANLDMLAQIQKAALLRRGYMQNAGAMGSQMGAGMFGAPTTYLLSQQ